MASENILTVTDGNFENDVLNSEVPVLLDFWAEWCGPCRSIAPFLDELADEYKGKVAIAKMNVDDNPEVPARFGVRGIPTLILFKGGEKSEMLVGADTTKIRGMVATASA